jgi:hypothetical protein
MFDWLSTYVPENKENKFVQRPFYLKRIHVNEPSSMNELAVFFIAGSVILTDNMMVSLSVKKPHARELILNDVATHFKEVKLVYFDDQVEVINMQYIKQESKAIFYNNKSMFMEIVRDLFRTKDMNNWITPARRALSRYTINADKIETLDIPNTQDVKRYITAEYIDQEQPLAFTPTGWKVEEDLKHSIFIRYMAAFVPKINLFMDMDKNEVISLELTK